MDSESLMLALLLQQQDLNLCERSSKGKQRAGELTDSDLAIEICRHEIQSMVTQVSDRVLAKSIARAVDTDARVIREAQLAEDQAARDRKFAISLSSKPNARAGPVASKGKKQEEFVHEVEDDLIDILKSMNLANDQSLEQAESSGWAASRKPPPTRQCIACIDRFSPLALFRSMCSHEYCRGCLVALVTSSLQDETLFPPRCCGQNIPVQQGRWFSSELVGLFQAKKLEFDTPNRTYCSKPTCSTFVPPAFIAGDIATCPRCTRKTCIHCKGRHHTGICPNDSASQQILQLATENGWQRCYSCHRLVELEIGCNHMTCICRAQFCYVCGERWKTCACPQWQEERLMRRAHDIVNRDDNVNLMDAGVRRARVERERANLMANHECTHDSWKSRQGPRQCEECYDVLPVFIYECRQCHTMACRRCRYNRL
ncbi:unnamed protein product [Fusarium langsethiae]|nr:unnamed protein product [Fusarium langsethiae]